MFDFTVPQNALQPGAPYSWNTVQSDIFGAGPRASTGCESRYCWSTASQKRSSALSLIPVHVGMLSAKSKAWADVLPESASSTATRQARLGLCCAG